MDEGQRLEIVSAFQSLGSIVIDEGSKSEVLARNAVRSQVRALIGTY